MDFSFVMDEDCSSRGACSEASLPDPPCEPRPEDCCGTGCTPCVYDIYEQEVLIWRKECERLQKRGVSEPTTGATKEMTADGYHDLELKSIHRETTLSFVYHFELPPGLTLHMRPGQHLVLRWQGEGKTLTRQYTPISPHEDDSYFDVVIKLYEDGAMSQFIRTWKVGDRVQWRGPFGGFTYRPNSFSHVLMLAAGTGLAPMVPVIRHILADEEEETRVTLFYSCRHMTEVLLKSQLVEWDGYWNFHVRYILSQDTPDDCQGKRYHDDVQYGRLTMESVQQDIHDDISKTLVLISGTKSFDKDMINFVKKIGLKDSNIFKF